MRSFTKALFTILAAFAVGCVSTPNQDRGPDGTRAYYIDVETSVPGMRIEAGGDYVGRSPIKIKVFGDPDGTFHNFGTYEYFVRALPDSTNLFPQTRVFRTGGWFSQEDRIPSRIYFDMSQKSQAGFSVDLPPRY